MSEQSVNPHCTCQPCNCATPCTCNLTKFEVSETTRWDANTQQLIHTLVTTYRSDPSSAKGKDPVPGHDHSAPQPPHVPHATAVISMANARSQAVSEPERVAAVTAAYGRFQAHQHAMHTDGHAAHGESVRTAQHKGHIIEIRTRYDVSIDGVPLAGHMEVDDDGRVHYHGLPNYSTDSGIDLIERVIDAFPDDFPPLSSREETV